MGGFGKHTVKLDILKKGLTNPYLKVMLKNRHRLKDRNFKVLTTHDKRRALNFIISRSYSDEKS